MSVLSDVKVRRFGFTLVELLVVIVVLGILASIAIVSYNSVVRHAHNSSAKHLASQYHKALTVYKIKQRKYPRIQADLVPGADSRVCLGTGYSDKNGDGVGDCGDPSWYSQVFPAFNDDLSSIIGISKVSETKVPVPYGTGDWTGVAFIKQEGGVDPFMVDGQPNPYFMMYMLFGANVDCGLSVVSERHSSDPLPHGWPNMKKTNLRYSYSDGKTTACVVAMPN